MIGAEVTDRLGYYLGRRSTLAHGSGEPNLAERADKPFTVVGILARTGTPVDRTVHIGLEAMEALHVDRLAATPWPCALVGPGAVLKMNLQPEALTAAFVGLGNRAAIFRCSGGPKVFPASR